MTIGQRIRAWRESRGLSERQLAEAIGVTPPAVYQWERHGKSPTIANLQEIADAIGVSMERFYGPIPKPKRKAS